MTAPQSNALNRHNLSLWVSPPIPLRSRGFSAVSSTTCRSSRRITRRSPLMIDNAIDTEKNSTVKTSPIYDETLIHQRTQPLVPYVSFEEFPDPKTVNVSGTLPHYLHNHVYYLVGPGLFEARHSDGTIWKAEHPFEGIGVVSSFRFNAFNSSVTFRSRVTSPRLLDAIQRTPGSRYRNFMINESPKSLWQKIREWRPPAIDFGIALPYTNYMVLVENIPGKGLCARTDYPCAQVIDPVTLAPTRQFRFTELHPKLGGTASTAHGIRDETTGEYFNIVWNMLPGKTDYNVFCTKKSGETYIIATVREGSYYMHSACMTENYFIIVLGPLKLSMLEIVLSGRVGNALKVVEGEDLKFVVISRQKGGVVRTFTHEYFPTMHAVNSYESGNDIVMDLCCSDPVKDIMTFREDRVRNKQVFTNTSIKRFVLRDVNAAGDDHSSPPRAISNMLVENAGDFPVISPRFVRKEHRFVYTVINSEGVTSGRLQKSDTVTGEVKKFGLPNCVLSEAAFVADPSGKAEDDGCLVLLALDTLKRQSIVIVLDARSFTEVARSELPVAVPCGVHACIHRMDASSPQIEKS